MDGICSRSRLMIFSLGITHRLPVVGNHNRQQCRARFDQFTALEDSHFEKNNSVVPRSLTIP